MTMCALKALYLLLALGLTLVAHCHAFVRASSVGIAGTGSARASPSSSTRLRYIDDCQSGSGSEVESQSSNGSGSGSGNGVQVELPSLEQLTKDSFTDQAYYAAALVDRLIREGQDDSAASDSSEGDDLGDLLTAQLSHREGMRGFLAVYLTHPDSPVDQDPMPAPLKDAMKAVNMEHLAPLACMNVVRPSAMAAWHIDPILQRNSLKTAERAKKFLNYCKSSINAIKNIQAIYAVASESVPNNTTNTIEQFWISLFLESRYDKEQRKAIAAAFSSFIQE